MRPRAAVLACLTGLLLGGSTIASVATPAPARAGPPAPTRLERATPPTVRLSPPVVTVGEPSSLVALLGTRNAGRTVTVERRGDSAWEPVGTAVAGASGRAVLALDTTIAGSQVLRVAGRAAAPVTLRVYQPSSCTPKIALVDPDATAAARCLAARLDRWRAAGLMGVGQQLNMSNAGYLEPLAGLGGRRVSVVGFDLEELAMSGTYPYPFLDQGLADLTSLASQGAVLSASWHAPNPHTGGAYSDRRWHDLAALLDPSTPEHAHFWADVDQKAELLTRLQDAGVAVVLRPFHEANGGWFWWGRPHPVTYQRLWTMLQQRLWAAGVHNVVWAYSFNAVTDAGVSDPVRLLPKGRVDVAGIDAYDPETARGTGADAVPLRGYAGVAARVGRIAMTEIGPRDSRRGSWDPAVISRAARVLRSKPVWALLWFDDLPPNDPLYLRQISSLRGGIPWLDSCPNGYCYLR